jgi:hypothetical protein
MGTSQVRIERRDRAAHGARGLERIGHGPDVEVHVALLAGLRRTL